MIGNFIAYVNRRLVRQTNPLLLMNRAEYRELCRVLFIEFPSRERAHPYGPDSEIPVQTAWENAVTFMQVNE